MSPARPAPLSRAVFLLLGLAVPALAAGQQVDGLVIGKTPCAEAIRGVYAQDLARMQALPDEDAVARRGAHLGIRKTKGDSRSYQELYTEALRRHEKQDLETAAKGPGKRGLSPEECSPFGYLGPHAMVAKALNLEAGARVDVAALGVKKCPYGSRFVSVAVMAPEVRLLCLEGVVGVYSKLVPAPLPQVREELAAKQGAPRDLGIHGLTVDLNTMTAPRFQAGAAFRHEDGLIVLTGFGSPPGGPLPVTQQGAELHHETPSTLNYDAQTEVLYLSRAAVDTLEQDKKLYDELSAKAAARQKKRK